jgi:hypothetical protein
MSWRALFGFAQRASIVITSSDHHLTVTARYGGIDNFEYHEQLLTFT